MSGVKSKESRIYGILLALLILAQLIYTVCVFTFQREGAHSDELWNYGYANSYYRPFLVADGHPNGRSLALEMPKHCNEWASGQRFHDYITVQPGERFAYGSVYYNKSTDFHPPLYCMLVHTVCSFFPNQFSYYYAFFVNCLCLIGTQIYLYLLASKLSGSRRVALLTCVLFGGGIGALSTYLFLRQYSLLTMLVVAYTYYGVSYLQAGEKYKRYVIGAAITAFLAFFTHFHAIAYIGVMTALMCILMLVRKEYRRMFLYGFSILGALVLLILVYPTFVIYLFDLYAPPVNPKIVKMQIKILLNYWAEACMGFHVEVYNTMFWKLFPVITGGVLVVLGLLAFVFRKESWFRRLMKGLKRVPGRLVGFLKRADYSALIILLSCLTMYVFVGKTMVLRSYGNEAIRFVFLTFPLLSCVFTTFAYFLLRRVPKIGKKSLWVISVLVLAILVKVQLTAPCYFLFQHFGDYQDVSELVKDKNVLTITYSEFSNHWMLPCYCPYVYTADHVFCTSADVMKDKMEEINSLGENIDYVLITAGDLELRPEEEALVNSWFDTQEDTEEADTNMQMVELEKEQDDIENDAADSEDDTSCAELIHSLNGGCDYHLLFGICIQDSPVYVLELIND